MGPSNGRSGKNSTIHAVLREYIIEAVNLASILILWLLLWMFSVIFDALIARVFICIL